MSLAQGLATPIITLKGVGEKRAKLLSKLGINVVEDLIFHFPSRYEDRTQLTPLDQLNPGGEGAFWGVVQDIEEIRPRPNLSILKVSIADDKGHAMAVWFNQPYLKGRFRPGAKLFLSGRVNFRFGEKAIYVKDFELLSPKEKPEDFAKILPIYPTTAGLPVKVIRKLIQDVIRKHAVLIPPTLPEKIRQYYNLMTTADALTAIHCPTDLTLAEKGRITLAYEELLLWMIGLSLNRTDIAKEIGRSHGKEGPLTKKYLDQLPFTLTRAQKRVLKEIFADMEKELPMSRLLQGDVGSGKTAIAIGALLKAIDNGTQGALMVPTEILAEQHYSKSKEILASLGVAVGFLSSSLPKDKKEKVRYGLAKGKIQLAIGTHALIQEEVKFADLGLVVIDEQHRFGVHQRGSLLAKGLGNPDLLVMTATPIPRTLALTFYGDLDFSVIDELPQGRLPIITRYIPENNRNEAYDFIKSQLDRGRQGYIICPLVEGSDKIQAEAATQLFDDLREGPFKNYPIGLIYGAMTGQEKEQIMNDFRIGKLLLLVATTVVEVGVDVPEANVILINGCERFGLAQLHQLRGRVGRGAYQSFCLLMGRPKTKEAKARIKIMVRETDGFALAEEDLKLRGPGDFFGVRQHGMPLFKVADLLRDQKLLQLAREDARIIIRNKNKKEYDDLLEKAMKNFVSFLP